MQLWDRQSGGQAIVKLAGGMGGVVFDGAVDEDIERDAFAEPAFRAVCPFIQINLIF